MNKLVKCLQDPNEKAKWNKNIMEVHHKQMVEGISNFEIVYARNKQQLQYQSRDFYNKSFSCFDDGAFYQLTSSIYHKDNETGDLIISKEKDVPENTVRADMVMSVSKMERDPSDGKIKYTYIV